MSGVDEARDQKGADVPGRPDYDDAHTTKYALVARAGRHRQIWPLDRFALQV
jgi:hypothetical protein